VCHPSSARPAFCCRWLAGLPQSAWPFGFSASCFFVVKTSPQQSSFSRSCLLEMINQESTERKVTSLLLSLLLI
jgi:hypothetical protein